MKAKKFLMISALVVLVGFIGGCHYGSSDDHRDYSRSGSYRDGYRDGRAAERRREDSREGRYYDRDYWGRRW